MSDPTQSARQCACSLESGTAHSPICPGNDTPPNLGPCICTDLGPCRGDPEAVCRYIADLMGYVEGDVLEDLFPGLNPMAATLAQGVLA